MIVGRSGRWLSDFLRCRDAIETIHAIRNAHLAPVSHTSLSFPPATNCPIEHCSKHTRFYLSESIRAPKRKDFLFHDTPSSSDALPPLNSTTSKRQSCGRAILFVSRLAQLNRQQAAAGSSFHLTRPIPRGAFTTPNGGQVRCARSASKISALRRSLQNIGWSALRSRLPSISGCKISVVAGSCSGAKRTTHDPR